MPAAVGGRGLAVGVVHLRRMSHPDPPVLWTIWGWGGILGPESGGSTRPDGLKVLLWFVHDIVLKWTT